MNLILIKNLGTCVSRIGTKSITVAADQKKNHFVDYKSTPFIGTESLNINPRKYPAAKIVN